MEDDDLISKLAKGEPQSWGIKFTTVNDNFANVPFVILGKGEDSWPSNDDNFSNYTAISVKIPSKNIKFPPLGQMEDQVLTAIVSQYTDEGRFGSNTRPNAGFVGGEYGTSFVNNREFESGGSLETSTQFKLTVGEYQGAGGFAEAVQSKWHNINSFSKINWEGFYIKDKFGGDLSIGQSYTYNNPINNKGTNLSVNGNWGGTLGNHYRGAVVGAGIGVGNLDYNDKINFKAENHNPDYFSSSDGKGIKWSARLNASLNYVQHNPTLENLDIEIPYKSSVLSVDGNSLETASVPSQVHLKKDIDKAEIIPSVGFDSSVEIGKFMLDAGVRFSGNAVNATNNEVSREIDLSSLPDGVEVVDVQPHISETNQTTFPHSPSHVTGNVSITYRF